MQSLAALLWCMALVPKEAKSLVVPGLYNTISTGAMVQTLLIVLYIIMYS